MAAADRLPFRTTCLVRALAADAMLRRRGHAPEIRFGVRTPETGATGIEAHAWLDLSGAVVLGEVERRRGYLEMSKAGLR
jgi:hypothetical protein